MKHKYVVDAYMIMEVSMLQYIGVFAHYFELKLQLVYRH